MKVVLYSLFSLCLFVAPVLGQQKAEGAHKSLIDGKLMYVGRMPNDIDTWIIHDLRTWGKYKPTREIEGVDLVMKAYKPETRTQYEMRRGIPRPKEVHKDRDSRHVMFSIGITNWITGSLVWQAEVLDRKPKRNDDAAPTDDARIAARGLSGQQLAQAITRELRRYVNGLSSESGGR
jgi:hypothetical protein